MPMPDGTVNVWAMLESPLVGVFNPAWAAKEPECGPEVVIDVAAPLVFAGQFERADTLIETLVRRYRGQGPPTLLHLSLVLLGYSARLQGRHERAEQLFAEAVAVAVPEGTPVKAAEDGVVAYSGNELKGYGNLVLVRHSNGYVTAYARASEVLVKRGDAIKRGQIIASGSYTEVARNPRARSARLRIWERAA